MNAEWPKDVAIVVLDEAVLRVVTSFTHELIGFVTRGYLNESGDAIVGRTRWFVAGHESIGFRSPAEAVWALRDYYAGHLRRGKIIPELRVNDSHEAVVKKMLNPQAERLVFKKRTRKKRRDLFDDLSSANKAAGITYH